MAKKYFLQLQWLNFRKKNILAFYCSYDRADIYWFHTRIKVTTGQQVKQFRWFLLVCLSPWTACSRLSNIPTNYLFQLGTEHRHQVSPTPAVLEYPIEFPGLMLLFHSSQMRTRELIACLQFTLSLSNWVGYFKSSFSM